MALKSLVFISKSSVLIPPTSRYVVHLFFKTLGEKEKCYILEDSPGTLFEAYPLIKAM